MTRFYFSLLACLLTLTAVRAQEIPDSAIVIPPDLIDENGFKFSYIDLFVDADTSDTGEPLHNTYLMEAGGIYFFSKRNFWDYDTYFGAIGDTEALGRPIVERRNASGGSALQDVYRGPAGISFDNLDITMGDKGPNAANYEVAMVRGNGNGVTYRWNNCILRKVRQALARSEGINEKVFVTNCHIYNLGDFGQFQGNGRLVSPRQGPVDSIVFRNNVIHNVLDRLYIGFRHASLNYFQFSGNTVFNHVGRHGFIQLSNTKESVIYNNFIQNPSIMGTAPSLADEQLNDLGEQIYVFSLDTIVEGGSVTMSNNNIHYTQDVLDHYATFDSVTKPNLYSPTFVQALTGDPADADFEEVLELEAVPSRDIVIQYAREAVQFKDSTGIANMMVEDSLFAIGTDYDRGYLFDFTRFSPCYDPTSQSATAGINGGAVGAVGAVYECDGLGTSTRQPVLNPQLRLTAMPNPAVNEISFTYETTQPGPVSFKLFDLTGKIVRNNLASNVQPGAHRLDFRNLSDLPGGTYIASLRTTEGRMFVKVIKQ